jgi:hypothetical protein
MADQLIAKYLDSIATQNSSSAETVSFYLQDFETFTATQLKMTVSDLIKKLKDGSATDDPREEQVYRVFQRYASWLRQNRVDTGNNNARTAKFKVSWAKRFVESSFIPISATLFKQLVKMPKPEEPDLSPVDKKTIAKLITSLEDIRLQSYSLWLASTGWRAKESLSIRLLNFEGLNQKTLKFEDDPSFINMSGKTAKTKKGKRRQITSEMRAQIEKLLAFNYRTREIVRSVNGKWKRITVNPVPKPKDRLFAVYHTEEEIALANKRGKLLNGEVTNLEFAYNQTAQRFRNAVDRLGIGLEEDGKRRKITPHTLRRFCYTQCTRAVDEQYAKYHVGRKVHEYDKRTPEEIAEDFAAVEPFLTFIDTTRVEEKQKVITKELENQRKLLEEERRKREDLEHEVNDLVMHRYQQNPDDPIFAGNENPIDDFGKD